MCVSGLESIKLDREGLLKACLHCSLTGAESESAHPSRTPTEGHAHPAGCERPAAPLLAHWTSPALIKKKEGEIKYSQRHALPVYAKIFTIL